MTTWGNVIMPVSRTSSARPYGEADRILHLYTPDRGRVSAIAKGVRRARSRFGGRLEPFFRLNLVLYEARSELLTVTSAETVAAHPRLREDAAALDGAARACEAVARVFDDGDPHAGVYHLLANELALLDGGSATTRTRCSSPCAPAPASRCRGCSTQSSTWGSTTGRSRAWPRRPTTSG